MTEERGGSPQEAGVRLRRLSFNGDLCLYTTANYSFTQSLAKDLPLCTEKWRTTIAW